MRQKMLFLASYYLFWVILSVMAKVIFLFYQGGEAFTLSDWDYWQIFFRGLRMDFSLGGYIILLSCLILAVTPFVKERVIRPVFTVLTIVLLFICAAVITVDLELFKNWGYHMDATPLLYIRTPKEAMASTPTGLVVLLCLLWVALVVVFYILYRKFVSRYLHYHTGNWWHTVAFVLLGGLAVIPIRGGFNVAPMNSSFVFFNEKSMFANQAAVNPVWNFMYEAAHVGKMKNDIRFMPQEEAQAIVDSLYRTMGDTPALLKNKHPNVVVLLLETFTANAIEALGGAEGVTPCLDRLAKEGVLFSNIYASGNRSDRGMVAVISAFPSHPKIAMIKYPAKMVKYPGFPAVFEANGYNTRFYYAGDINFGSFRSFVTMNFEGMVTEDDFSGAAIENRFKWGVHDQYMFERLYEDVSTAAQPFMYMAFNMSSHEPFKVPMETKIKGNATEDLLKNAIYYSDSCIGNFMDKCKESGLWDNTLFVLVADHGTRHIGGLEPYAPDAYRIPVIFTGGALNVKDTIVSTIGSQTDMAATLLAQLGMDHSMFPFSKNLLAARVAEPFAFYSYSNAVGVVSTTGVSIYDLNGKHFIQHDTVGRGDTLLKAYLQVVDKVCKE